MLLPEGHERGGIVLLRGSAGRGSARSPCADTDRKVRRLRVLDGARRLLRHTPAAAHGRAIQPRGQQARLAALVADARRDTEARGRALVDNALHGQSCQWAYSSGPCSPRPSPTAGRRAASAGEHRETRAATGSSVEPRAHLRTGPRWPHEHGQARDASRAPFALSHLPTRTRDPIGGWAHRRAPHFSPRTARRTAR